MDRTLVLKETEPGIDILKLEPGFYSVDCKGRFPRETVEAHLNCSLSPEILAGCFSGVLLPYFLHNINNLMVGVMGNLDLAGMFMPELAKVEPKLGAARAATGSVVDFIRDITEISPPSLENELSSGDLEKVLTTIKAACGRSVSTEGLDGFMSGTAISCSDSASLLNAIRGMGVWCVLCVGGNGSVAGTGRENIISLSWTRPKEAGKSHMPGGESAAAILSIAGGSAISTGYTLLVENWTDSSGTVTIAFK